MIIKGKIYTPTWMDVLSSIEEGQTRQELIINAKVTFCHGIKITQELIKMGFIIKCKKVGRTIPIELTLKGKKLKEVIIKMKTLLSEVQD